MDQTPVSAIGLRRFNAPFFDIGDFFGLHHSRISKIIQRTFRTPQTCVCGVFRSAYPSLGCCVKQLTGTSNACKNACCVAVKGLASLRWPSMQRTRTPLNFQVTM